VKRLRWRWILLVLGCAAGLVWRYQSELIGLSAGWYLRRVAAREVRAGDLTQRRAIVERTHRLLLMPPPPDALVPELFELATAMAQRGASGAISFNWSAYIYTSYYRDLVRDRPNGEPARTPAQVDAELDRYVEFYALQKRPDTEGVRLSDILGGEGESYSLDEIERADREGRALPLR
jgi:hypothetical protein